MVLGRGADQRRSADIDILDASFRLGATANRVLERIERDGEEIDVGNAVILKRLFVRGVAAHRKQTAMDLGMQRLHPPVHHLRHAGDVGDVDDIEARLAQQLGGAAGGDELDALSAQALGKLHHARLVADRKERAGNLLHGR